MEYRYDEFEIVSVRSDCKLVDTESYERRYLRAGRDPLSPGVYIVHWADGVHQRRFDEHANFIGPFPNLRDAHCRMKELRDQRPAGARHHS